VTSKPIFVSHERPVTAAATPIKAPQYVDPWSKVLDAEKNGSPVEVKVKSINKGGLVVNVGDLKGFIPYNQVAATTLRKGHLGDLSYLVGQTLTAKVVSVDAQGGRKEVILSEKKAKQSAAMKGLKLGDVVAAVVASVEDYGAFVELSEMPGVFGLVHKTELSWDPIMSVDDVVQKGQSISVKVIDVDASKCRLGLSLKQMQPDPIKVTLDKVEWGPTTSMAPEIQRLMDRLRQQVEVTGVAAGRQATEAKVSSQELVVYLTKEQTEGAFKVVARLGHDLQEIIITTAMSKEELRAMLPRVVKA